MHRLLTTTLTFAILVHTTFGCCFLHHAHGCQELGSSASSCCQACSDASSLSQLDSTHSSVARAANGLAQDGFGSDTCPDPCSDGKCSFARTEASVTADLPVSDLLLFPLQLPSLITVLPRTSFPHFYSALGAPSDSLRLHLCFSVLLI